MKLKKILFFSLLTIFAGGCNMLRNVEYKTDSGIALEKTGFDFTYDEDAGKIYLAGPGGTMIMNINRRISHFNGTKIWLFTPAKLDKDGILRISENDIEKIIIPLLGRKYLLTSPVKRIVIDAGHGGNDNGAVGLKYKEKDLNLALSRKIKSALEAKGFEVIMTRNEDIFLTLEERSKFAKEQKADLFLCIHHNASPATKTASGIETFSLSAPHVNSTHDKKGIVPAGILPGNAFDNANINLNYQIQSHIINNLSVNDRGMKFARFRVLVNAPCPAILLEAGFVSNPTEEIAVSADERQNKIACSVAEAVQLFSDNAMKQQLKN